MLALSPITQPAPAALAALARLLSSERAFESRIADMFGLLRAAVDYGDARLICWNASASGGHRIFTSDDALPQPWDDTLADQTAQQLTVRRVSLAPAAMAAAADSLTIYSAPVVWLGQLHGVVELRSTLPEAFSPAEQAFMAALIPLLAAAIATAPAPQAQALAPRPAELSIRQHRLLDTARAELEDPFTLNELLLHVLRWAMDTTGAEAGMISLVDHDQGELIVQVFEGYPREPFSRDTYGEAKRRWSWSAGLAGKVAREGRALLLRDVSHDPDFIPATPEIRAELAVPIGEPGHAVAVMVLDSPRSAAFGEAELAFVRALAQAAQLPLQRAMGYQHALETSMQLGQVFGSIPSGLALIDGQGKLLRYNPAWLAIWGLDDGDIDAGFHLPWDLVTRLLARLTDPLKLSEFCTTGQANPTDIQQATIMLRDPHQELEVFSVPTRDSLGQLTGRLWVLSDVTREREADRLKSEFISIVSHELRTPLTSILGYTELLLARSFTPAEQKDFIKTVYDQANYLSQIVEDMLGISRIEAGNVRLNQWVVSLRQLISEMIAQLNTHVSSRHRVVIDVPQRLTPAYLDRDRIKQVLVNLVTNAIKYSPKGGEITLRVQEHPKLPPDHPEGSFLLVSVSDQGMGIPSEDLSRIWERFYRVDNSNTRRIGGTGLGLSITKALVELHGGRIWVESKVGVGSTFFFSVPAATEAMAAMREP
ncbi:GAF domain-containing protein [Chloroflexia bacterium SDU3-3]|nr:GAF domain-containing protein [Chloroflexia bacterium SDU3-3]